MKIIKFLISLLEFQVGKDDKIYTEQELEQFAKKAKSYSIILPPNTFPYAVKAKKSKNPDVVKMAEKAEVVAFFIYLPVLLLILAIIIAIPIAIIKSIFFGN